MEKYRLYNNAKDRNQYKWSSQNAGTINRVHTAGTVTPGHGKVASRHHCKYNAPSNGPINQHKKPTTIHLHNNPRHYNSGGVSSTAGSNKYVYVCDNKERVVKPTASNATGQLVNNTKIMSNSTKQLTSSRNDVFVFPQAPKHKITSAQNLVSKTSVSVQGPPKAGKPQAATYTQHLPSHKKSNSIIPSRSQLKWTSNDVSNITQPRDISSNGIAQASHMPLSNRTTPSSFNKSKFAWRRSSSGAVRQHSASNVSSYIVNKRYKMVKRLPKRLIYRRPRLNSAKRVVYIGGVAYNASARRLSRRRSSGSYGRSSITKGVAKKTGNKVWIAEHKTGQVVEENFVHPGYEIRPKKGNWQWIAGNKSALARQANAIKSKYAVSKSRHVSLSRKQKAKYFKVFIKNDVFVTDPSQRRLKRLSRTSTSSISKFATSLDPVPRRSSTHQLASHAVRRSKALVWHAAKSKKKDVPKSEQYCMFYNRFGKCTRRGTCPYIHDPHKVAVCTRFLRGTCEKTDGSCPFSHLITKEKMPVCSYFLRGVCTKDECPYLHVYVGENAEICRDFVKGFCPNGDKCDKKHLLECPDFVVSGKCPRGDKCPLRHKKIVRKRRTSSLQAASKEPKAFKRRRVVNQSKAKSHEDILASNSTNNSDILITPDQLEFIPLEQGPSTPPDFIAL